MIDITKSDWKLFQTKVLEWQEIYMERLLVEYVEMLNGPDHASSKFRALEERIGLDKKNPGVRMELCKSEVVWDITNLIRWDVITVDDLEGFSVELVATVKELLERVY